MHVEVRLCRRRPSWLSGRRAAGGDASRRRWPQGMGSLMAALIHGFARGLMLAARGYGWPCSRRPPPVLDAAQDLFGLPWGWLVGWLLRRLAPASPSQALLGRSDTRCLVGTPTLLPRGSTRAGRTGSTPASRPRRPRPPGNGVPTLIAPSWATWARRDRGKCVPRASPGRVSAAPATLVICRLASPRKLAVFAGSSPIGGVRVGVRARCVALSRGCRVVSPPLLCVFVCVFSVRVWRGRERCGFAVRARAV